MIGRWFLDLYINIQWMWMNVERQHWENSAYGFKKSKTKKICIVFRGGSVTLGNGHVVSFDMSTLWDRLQILDSDVRGTLSIAEFLDRVEGDTKTKQKIP